MSTPRTVQTFHSSRLAAFALSVVMTLAMLAGIGALAEPDASGVYLVHNSEQAVRG